MNRSPGFTVIEVVLFLAISSGLAIFLLVGTSAAIQRQQYKDATQSYAGFLRGQYERVIGVKNDRSPTEVCPIATATSASASRGQSDCVILGRYIASTNEDGVVDQQSYGAYPVYGLPVGGVWHYGLGERDTDYNINWSASARLAGDAGESPIAILIYRDPETGSMVVRTSRELYEPSNIGNFFEGVDSLGDAYSLQLQSKEICIYSDSVSVGERRSVFLGEHSGSADAVTVGNSSEACS